GTRAESFPGGEVAAIREQTRSPIIIVASSTATELLEEALEAEVADVLVLPQLIENVVFSIRKSAHAKRQLSTVARSQQGRGVRVLSAKGRAGNPLRDRTR